MSKNLFKLLIKYFFIGILAASIELLIFSFFTKYLNYVIANSIAYSFGIITSFTLNKFYNFKVKDKTIIRFGRFLIVNISGLFISNLILIYFSGLLPLIELKILSMPIVIFFQFMMNYLWTFKK
jgi:putative flippase GtrA|tara:strand:- start:545 stop:916 length:372 start_codon:yes stop_codon:yes gene_type:complete